MHNFGRLTSIYYFETEVQKKRGGDEIKNITLPFIEEMEVGGALLGVVLPAV